jgi:predicted lysophospholipase L1 biosynthesis ABC-type transport system permease subunit
MRNLLAFIVAPLLPAILPAWQMAQAPNRSGFSAYIFVCCVFYLVQGLVGIPAFLLFSRRGRHQLWPYLLLGFVTSAVPVPVGLLIYSSLKVEIIGIGLVVLYFGMFGALTALIFWLVARPDKKPVSELPSTAGAA